MQACYGLLIFQTGGRTPAGITAMIQAVTLPKSESLVRFSSLLNGSRGTIVLLTGLSGAGKSTIAQAVNAGLLVRGLRVQVLDGDEVRRNLSRDLGYSREDRNENVRRLGFIASLMAAHGVVVLVAVIAPYREARDMIRAAAGCRFIEVFVAAPLEICERRDPKGLYKKARRGELKGFTGIDDPYEEPSAPDVRCNTHLETLEESAGKVIAALLTDSGVELLV